MRFVYPMGLLGLIGIPILIIIYIILNKHTEKTVSSTYLWTLSEKFIKRRVPISRLANIISLILQIIAIALISLAIAHPMIIVPNSASAYCFVLDGSGSMNVTQSGKSRFDVAKGRIEDIISDSMSGSTYTLILAGNSSQTIYRDISTKSRAIDLLNSLSCGHASKPLEDAMILAQRYFDENPSLKTYVLTDKLYEKAENVNIIYVYTDVENYAVSNVEYDFSSGVLDITGTVISYESDRELTVELYFDDAEEPYETKTLDVLSFEQTPFEFVCNLVDFRSMKLVIPEKDALMLDNEIIVYNARYENLSETVIVSENSFYIRSALTSAGNTQLKILTPEEYEANEGIYSHGYGLYVYDNYMPDSLPNDGPVWFINPQKTVAGTNFGFQNITVPRELALYSTSTSTFIRNMLDGVVHKDFPLAKYSKCGLFGRFTTLVTCENNPILFVGTNAYGYREVVFAFDLKDSAPFTMSSDLTSLTIRLLRYSFPEVIEETSFYSGEIMPINVIAGCNSIVVTSPQGRNSYLETISDVVEYELTDVGLYTIRAIMKDGSDRIFNAYASLPEEERIPFVQESSVVLLGTPENKKTNGIFDTLFTIFIILAVFAVADYGVYCYEQYQLR
ncbi:MAG: VWA domain-containing protein [Clostridiales bacterium]|nr:VWA domain-containing protein [Clostridiales bacterium]